MQVDEFVIVAAVLFIGWYIAPPVVYALCTLLYAIGMIICGCMAHVMSSLAR